MEGTEFWRIASQALETTGRIRFSLYQNHWRGFEALKDLTERYPTLVRLVNFSSWDSLKEKLEGVWQNHQSRVIVLEFVLPTPDGPAILSDFIAPHVEYVEVDAYPIPHYLHETQALRKMQRETICALKLRIPPHLFEIVADEASFITLLDRGQTAFYIYEGGMRACGFADFSQLQAALLELEEMWEGEIAITTKINQAFTGMTVELQLKNSPL